MVVNSHLHFDHCGQNAVFAHAPIFVQRKELESARRESTWQKDWLDYAGARYELLDGDVELGDGLRIISTPGHTAGHQCVVADTGLKRPELLIGDAAFRQEIYQHPEQEELPPGQEEDRPAWESSLERLRALKPARIHFCHDPAVLTG
jgi:N-acyl homoserine lactone hydrolase